MDIIEIIEKKRDGYRLSKEETEFFIKGYTEGDIPDYQASALLMALYIRGMDEEEIFMLTDAMMHSGDIVDLSDIPGIKVDKHSTGGVGDKTSLIIAPIAASCGVPVAKMSGRGLGFTGGTIDKLESIPGFKTSETEAEFKDQVKKTGIAIIGQTSHVAAADKKLYALRDVTGTVASPGLITSSIMSKKLASGSDAILLDVKCGNGAFMKTDDDAEKLGRLMVSAGIKAGRKMAAVISDMSSPLGRAVGNALEVKEAVEILKGKGPDDLKKLTMTLAGGMICLGDRASCLEDGIRKAENAVADGSAINKFRELIAAQGGNPEITDNTGLLPGASVSEDVISMISGYVSDIHAEKIGIASQHAGAGRLTKEDAIDMAAGVYIFKKPGEKVLKGEKIATVYGSDADKVKNAAKEVYEAYVFSDERPAKRQLIKKIIGL